MLTQSAKELFFLLLCPADQDTSDTREPATVAAAHQGDSQTPLGSLLSDSFVIQSPTGHSALWLALNDLSITEPDSARLELWV